MSTIRNVLFYITHVNIIKTIFYSLKFRGRVVVGKGRIHIRGNSKISFSSKKSILFIGINYSYPVPTVVDIYGGELYVEGRVSLNRGVKVRIFNGGVLKINNNTFINEGSKIYCSHSINIGKDTAIAFNSLILDTDIHSIYKDEKCINSPLPVTIGNNVWLAANSVVLKGSVINDNIIVGASSTVMSKLEDSNCIYAGTPARSMSKFDYWKI